MKNIVLIGFMGTGKSAAGRRIAKRLDMRFVSTDDMIVKREKRPITRIFTEEGEAYFREVEKEAVKEAAAMDNVVIAAGGGAVLDEENMSNLGSKGVIVCLTASPEAIYERTKKYKTRPLLNVEDPVSKIRELLEARAPFYRRARYQVDTSDKTINEVAGDIIGIMKK